MSVFYERGNFGGMADKAFNSMMDDPRNAHVSKYFLRMALMGWKIAFLCNPLISLRTKVSSE